MESELFLMLYKLRNIGLNNLILNRNDEFVNVNKILTPEKRTKSYKETSY